MQASSVNDIQVSRMYLAMLDVKVFEKTYRIGSNADYQFSGSFRGRHRLRKF